MVVDREFLPGGHALMVPRTADGRVLFGVPWLAFVLKADVPTALSYGFTPFLIGDAIKLILAVILLPLGWRFIGDKASAKK